MVLEEDVGCCGGQTKPGPAMTTVQYTLILPCKQQPPRATSQVHKGVGRGEQSPIVKTLQVNLPKIFSKNSDCFCLYDIRFNQAVNERHFDNKEENNYSSSTKVFNTPYFPSSLQCMRGRGGQTYISEEISKNLADVQQKFSVYMSFGTVQTLVIKTKNDLML